MKARLAILLLAAGCGGRYFVNEAGENVPNVFLHKVHASGGETELTMRFEADEACAIGVGAFTLRAGEATLKLTDVSGVAEAPEKTSVAARGSERFTLTFEALPEGVREFEVVGEIEGIGPVAFIVDLDAPNVVRCIGF
jgi:hypothetical protein